jgi:hypothetical protein
VETQIPPIENENVSGSISANDDFSEFITRMCEANKWATRELDNEHAIIEFTLDQTRSQTLFVFGFEKELEFSVPSFAAFDSLDNVPHLISSTLLQMNAKTKIGFWCLEQIGDKIVFTYMHNVNMNHVDESLFHEIVTTLIQRVDEFENLLVKMSGDESSKTENSQ